MSHYSRTIHGHTVSAEDQAAEDGVRFLDQLSFEELKDGRFFERAKTDSDGYDFEAEDKDYTLVYADGDFSVRRRHRSGGWF